MLILDNVKTSLSLFGKSLLTSFLEVASSLRQKCGFHCHVLDLRYRWPGNFTARLVSWHGET